MPPGSCADVYADGAYEGNTCGGRILIPNIPNIPNVASGNRPGRPPKPAPKPGNPQTLPQTQTQQQKYKQCMSNFKNSTLGKVVGFGSLLSFFDNAKTAFKQWAEVGLSKGSYWKVVEWGGQSAAGPGEITAVVTEVTPVIEGLGAAGVGVATFIDLGVRSGCSAAAAPAPPSPQPALWTGGS